MKKVIVYNIDGNLALVIPSDDFVAQYGVVEIARKDVPEGVAYKIFNYDDMPWDNYELADAWEVDFSEPDGYGIGQQAWLLEQMSKGT